MSNRFSHSIVHQLKFYVYIYLDPRDGSVFYVGKGRGNRAFAHLECEGPSAKIARIEEIRAEGMEPQVEILVHGLTDEATAFKIEAAIIDLIGPEYLTNEVRGYHSRTHGRMSLNQIKALYGAEPITIKEPAILIRINKAYRHTMTPLELYEATRAYWKVGKARELVQLAMAVYDSVIREVYEVVKWFPAHSTFITRNNARREDDRWEFVGRVASDSLRKKYLHGDVGHYFAKGSQNPIQYVNIKE